MAEIDILTQIDILTGLALWTYFLIGAGAGCEIMRKEGWTSIPIAIVAIVLWPMIVGIRLEP